MKFVAIFLILIASLWRLSNANPCSIQPPGSLRLVCENIQEFPVERYGGLYDELVIAGTYSNFTKIPYNAFPGIAANVISIVNHQSLEEIEYGFLDGFLVGREGQTKRMNVNGNRNLKIFPWNLFNFTSLQTLEMNECGFETIPANIEWPETIETITLNALLPLKTIESNAFNSAINLKSLNIQNSGDILVQTNGFRTTSKHVKSLSQYSWTSKATLEADAFGIESGGELWNTIALPTTDFPENVFRKMLSKAAEAGLTSLLTNAVGTTVLPSCQTCDVAWLYQDAKKYGIQLYEGLVGQSNVICPEYNSPLVTTTDPDFIDFMENCLIENAPCHVEQEGLLTLVCSNIKSFPVLGHEGTYERLVVAGLNLTKIPNKAFPGIFATYVEIVGSSSIIEIENGFLDDSASTVNFLQIQGMGKLEILPWTDFQNFIALQALTLEYCNSIKSIPSNIEWPESIEHIRFHIVYGLESIEPFAFSSAKNLKYLDVIGTTFSNFTVKSNGFHTTSKHEKVLTQYTYIGKPTVETILDPDAFGISSGSELWNQIMIMPTEFSEFVFREMLIKAAENGFQSLISWYSYLELDSCNTCDISWLYRDSNKYGVELYKNLTSGGGQWSSHGIYCPDDGNPVIGRNDEEFVSLMDSCYNPCYENGNHLVCDGIEDLPIVGYEGTYESLDIMRNFHLKSIKRNSFPGISAKSINVVQNPELVEIEDGFMEGSEDQVKRFYMQYSPKFMSEGFPWNYTEKFTNLAYFELQFMDILTVPGNIQWSKSVNTIKLQHCEKLNLIEPYAFSTATNLTFLELYTTGDGLVVKPNGFHTQSKEPKTLLQMQSYTGDRTVLEGNAFGFDSGSELWDLIAIPVKEFPENVFRSMMKGAFEQNKESLLGSNVGSMNVKSCSTCDAAWLWEDAHTYGVDAYEKLTGGGVYCQDPSIGPVITNENPDFIALMNSCINDKNPCENAHDTDVPDPDDCRCFYQCDFGGILGHICCPDGLVFNPNSLVCDYPSSYPECQV